MLGEGVGERREQGEGRGEWGSVGLFPSSARTKGRGSGLGVLWLGKGAVERGQRGSCLDGKVCPVRREGEGLHWCG